MKFGRLISLLVILVIVALLVAACGGDDDGQDESDQAATSDLPVIKIIELPWLAAQLDVAVARIILEQEMGYPVEVIPLPGAEQWDMIASGEAHASLEVWTSSFPNQIQQYIHDEQTVEDGGSLGAIGQSGWYIPHYMQQQFEVDFHDWESLRDPAVVAALATEETGDSGRFLGGDSGWNDQAISEILLENLELDYVIEATGSEAAEIEVLLAAFENEEPVLFYFWTPHWLMALHVLNRIPLPAYSEECYAVQADIDCDFAQDELMKILWPGLADYAPDAYQFLRSFTLTNRDQIAMMATVEIDEQSIEQAAQDWIETNEDTWRAWIPDSTE